MKKGKAILGMISALLVLSSCQPNPEDSAVVGKNDGILESAIEKEVETVQSAQWPESCLEEFVCSDNVTVCMDADIQVPDVDKYPVIRVTPHEITVEEAKSWGDVLFQNYPAWEALGTMTKDEIAEMILQLKQAISPGGSLEEEYASEPETLKAIKLQLEEEIAFYESKYESAPEGYEREDAEWVFHPQSYYDYDAELSLDSADYLNLNKTMTMRFDVMKGDKSFFFRATNRNEEDFKIHSIFWSADFPNVYQLTPLSYPNEELEKMAEDVLAKTGLEDRWKLKEYYIEEFTIDYEMAMRADPGNKELEEKAKNPETQYWYELVFVPEYEGVEVTKQNQLETVNSGDSYASNYYYESLTMKVSNDQIIDAYWNSPMDMVSIENENVELLSWEEIFERFRTQAQNQYTKNYFAGDGSSDVVSAEILVDEIILGLARIRVQNSNDEYYYIPAWTFRGNAEVDRGKGAFPVYEDSENLMTINAIDGSVINTVLGY